MMHLATFIQLTNSGLPDEFTPLPQICRVAKYVFVLVIIA
jgi:hypothetical protein